MFCVASEITLSPLDLESMWKGLVAMGAGLFLMNLVQGVLGGVELRGEALRLGLFAAQTLLFFVLLADLAFLAAMRLAWQLFARRRH